MAEEVRQVERKNRPTIKTPPPMAGDDALRQEEQRLQENEQLRLAYDEHVVRVSEKSCYDVVLMLVFRAGAQDEGRGASAPTSARGGGLVRRADHPHAQLARAQPQAALRRRPQEASARAHRQWHLRFSVHLHVHRLYNHVHVCTCIRPSSLHRRANRWRKRRGRSDAWRPVRHNHRHPCQAMTVSSWRRLGSKNTCKLAAPMRSTR